MKTIREWLEELPEPYRTQAINNYDLLGPYPPFIESPYDIETLWSAVLNAFDWSESKEGNHYWDEFHNTLLYTEKL